MTLSVLALVLTSSASPLVAAHAGLAELATAERKASARFVFVVQPPLAVQANL